LIAIWGKLVFGLRASGLYFVTERGFDCANDTSLNEAKLAQCFKSRHKFRLGALKTTAACSLSGEIGAPLDNRSNRALSRDKSTVGDALEVIES
jgi:hypothetical protein